MTRPTTINRHEPLWRRFQRAAIDYLRALESRGPVAVPAELATAIQNTARAEFGTRRFTFAQLLNATFTLPELAWWYDPGTLPNRVDTLVVPPEDRSLFARRALAAHSGEQAAVLLTEALRQAGEWAIEITPPTPHSSERLVFHRLRECHDHRPSLE
jgi:hypothetical protein